MMMKTPANRWTPHWAIHPGEHLRECIEAHGLTTEEFARRIEVPVAIVEDAGTAEHVAFRLQEEGWNRVAQLDPGKRPWDLSAERLANVARYRLG